jgi:hypothetical protein
LTRFSLREPVSTSLENALIACSGIIFRMNGCPVKLGRQETSVTAINMVMLSAAAIRIAESPIWSVLFQIDLGHASLDQGECSFDANFAVFHEKSISVSSSNLA